MQREEEGSELKTRKKYFLLGPCYHLVRNVQIKEENSENRDLSGDKMGETEGAEVRDIKKEKVRVLMEKSVLTSKYRSSCLRTRP